MSEAAHRWLRERFQPAAQALAPFADRNRDVPEVYCEVLEHKWYLSEHAQRDVGLDYAIEDFVKRFQNA